MTPNTRRPEESFEVYKARLKAEQARKKQDAKKLDYVVEVPLKKWRAK